MTQPIKIIDLFAGPGGLGEGFSSLIDSDGNPRFKISLSIEKEESAHRTLTLRAFFRQFPRNKVPDEYYEFLTGRLGKNPSEQLYKTNSLKKQVQSAHDESRCLTLGKDNKEIHAAIDEALGRNIEPWVLIGGPPCQAYSLVGRARNKGNTAYSAENDHRNFLYLEYLKVIAKFQPAVFVMENVKGMLSAKINGKKIIDDILSDLKRPNDSLKLNVHDVEYEIFSLSKELLINPLPTDFLIRSEEYGIPQARHRVILLGVRKDIANKITPGVLTSNKGSSVTVKDVISDLPKLRSGLSKFPDTKQKWATSIINGNKELFSELEKMQLKPTAELMQESIKHISDSKLSRGQNWSQPSLSKGPKKLADWYQDPSGRNLVCNHETRGHIKEDLKRYLFCSCYSASSGLSTQQTPKAKDFPKILAPHHGSWSSGKFSDRFKVQLANKVASTITSHISKDGHYYIHYDPQQCRSLTVREAARIQTFPDNYFFVGTRTQQYVQVGNAVPPYLAKQISSIVFDILAN